jgi:hypothetical protein
VQYIEYGTYLGPSFFWAGLQRASKTWQPVPVASMVGVGRLHVSNKAPPRVCEAGICRYIPSALTVLCMPLRRGLIWDEGVSNGSSE